jgi:hypothetical protein
MIKNNTTTEDTTLIDNRPYGDVPFNTRHGSPFDRGHSDSYYRRAAAPHFYKGATGSSERVEVSSMSYKEIEAYIAGYKQNEEVDQEFKDYGYGGGR